MKELHLYNDVEIKGIFLNYFSYVRRGVGKNYYNQAALVLEEAIKRGGCRIKQTDIEDFKNNYTRGCNSGNKKKSLTKEEQQKIKSAKSLDQRIVDKYRQIQGSASSRGKEFNLSLDKIKKLLTTERCYYTGVRLNDIDGDPNSRTFERLEQDKGYIDSNVVACSFRANQLKERMFECDNKFTKKQLQMMVNKLRG